MSTWLRAALGLAALLSTGPAGAAPDDALPAVARPRFTVPDPSAGPGGTREVGSGTAFFLAEGPTAVAVTAAHSFDLDELSQADLVEFRLGHTQELVATSSAFLVEPGRAFQDLGGSFREDRMIFKLDGAPRAVRTLRAGAAPRKGDRVRILGVPAAIAQNEDDLFGTVARSDSLRLEIELDVHADLRGWGGAPVLAAESGHVVGILEAAWPDPGRSQLRLGAAPIDAIRDAMTRPLDGGRGRPFGRYAQRSLSAAVPLGAAGEPMAAPSARRGSAPPAPEGAPQSRSAAPSRPPASAPGTDAPDARASGEPPPITASATAPDEDALLGVPPPKRSQLELTVEYPNDGAIVADPMGAFLTGRALSLLGEFRRFDVMIVIDTSGSTGAMSGSDINGNGVVGRNRLFGVFGGSDPGDSILAAEVAAARRMVEGLDPRNARVGVVSFSGHEQGRTGAIVLSQQVPLALTQQPLTADHEKIEQALHRVLMQGPVGGTHMAAGIDEAWKELVGLPGALSEPDPKSEKIVLFLTDGQPTLPYEANLSANVRAVMRAAQRAAKLDVRIHAFAIGPEALAGPIAPIQMASITGGDFTPVRHPGDLVDVIDSVSFANIESLTVRNLTAESDALEVELASDGTFSALVPVEAGRNRIEVFARASDGQEAREELMVQYAPDVPTPEIPKQHAARRNQLLERRLISLKREGIMVERDHAERARRALELEIQQERARAHERAEGQRRELDLEAEPGAEAAP